MGDAPEDGFGGKCGLYGSWRASYSLRVAAPCATATPKRCRSASILVSGSCSSRCTSPLSSKLRDHSPYAPLPVGSADHALLIYPKGSLPLAWLLPSRCLLSGIFLSLFCTR